MRKWYQIPYRQVESRGAAERWNLDLNMPDRAFNAQIVATDGYWVESQQDNRQALVCVRTTAELHADLALQYASVDDPSTRWLPSRAKIPGSAIQHVTKPIAAVEEEVLDVAQLVEYKRLSDETMRQADRDGYVRVTGAPLLTAYLLQRAARHGYGLDRISPGTFPTTGILETFSVDAGPPPSAAWGGTHNGGSLALKSLGGVCVIDSNFGTSYYNTQFSADQEVYCTLTASGGNYVGLYARLQSPGSGAVDGYTSYYSENTNVVEHFRIDNNTETSLGAATALSHGLAVGDSVGVEAKGTALTGQSKVAGVWYTELAIVDATYNAAGYIGLTLQNININVDAFGGGNMAGGGITGFARGAFPKGKLCVPMATRRK